MVFFLLYEGMNCVVNCGVFGNSHLVDMILELINTSRYRTDLIVIKQFGSILIG